MQFKTIIPTGFLNQYIKYYWIMESEGIEADQSERVIPTGNVQIMFHYKRPFIVTSPDDIINVQPTSFVSGLTNTWCDVSTNGETGLIAVTFNTSGACHFFPFPLLEIEEQNIKLDDIYSHEIRLVEEQLGEQPLLADKIRLIEAFLISRYSPIPRYDQALIHAGISYIRQRQGQLSSSVLSEKLAVTTKTLERKFSVYLGKTPKQLIRIVRFQQVLSDLQALRQNSLTEVAYRNGYYDQSHFIRDFRVCAGYTPKDFLSIYSCSEPEKDSIR